MKRLLLLASILLAAWLAWHFSKSDESLREEVLVPELVLDREAPDETDLADQRGTNVGRVEQPAAKIVEVAPPTVIKMRTGNAVPASTASTNAVTVRGMIVLVDETGLEYEGMNGKADCTLWRESKSTHDNFKIHRGRFELEISSPAQFELGRVILDGEVAVPEVLGARFDVGDKPLVLRVVRPVTIELHVLDATSGRHLDGVEMRTCAVRLSMSRAIPDGQWTVREVGDGRSPLSLQALESESMNASTPFLVRSPGYAWTPLQLDMRKTGQIEVRLEAAARLTVELVGDPKQSGSRLCLYADEPDRKHSATFAAFQDPGIVIEVGSQRNFEFADLNPGAYDVRLQIGDSMFSRVTLCESSVDIPAGASQRVVLNLNELPEIERGRLVGRVRIPAEWQLSEFSVYADKSEAALEPDKKRISIRSNTLVPKKGSADTFSFSFGALQVGEYSVGVRAREGATKDLDYGVTVELTSNGPADLLIDVPPPAMVSIRVIDSRSGEPIDGRLSWRQVRAARKGTTLDRVFDSRRSFANSEFKVPVGEISVSFDARGYMAINEQLTIVPGRNELVFKVELGCVVHLQLRDGDARIPWSTQWTPGLECLDGSGKLNSYSPRGEGRKLTITAPGRYRVNGLELAGFEPIASIEFEAMLGEDVQHIIHLTRN